MEGGHRGWTGQGGAGSGNSHAGGAGGSGGGGAGETSQSQAARAGASFGPQHPSQQSPPTGHAGLAAPTGHFSYQQQPQPSHLVNLAGISQSSPRQPPLPLHRPEGQQAQQGPGFPLPAINQATGQPGATERERERAEQIHIKEEQDRQHREIERQRMEQAPPHQTQQGPPIHLHQPVAIGPRTAHGPNGLLGNPAMAGPQPQPPYGLGAQNGPAGMFAGGPVQPAAQVPAGQSGMMVPQYATAAQAQAAQQQMGQGQGQQPILNDALSYLDQVKVQFADHPDVYNRFLDIMKDFKSGAIDTPGVIGRVSQLFAGNPELIQGFNTFLPPGYRIECGSGDDPNAIRVTTPAGTTVQAMPQPRPLSRQEGADSARRANGTYTPQPNQGPQMLLSPSGRAVGPAIPTQHLSLEAARQSEQQAMHQQEQRGVNQLQNAISAAAGAAGLRAGMSPVPGRATPLADGLAADSQGAQAGLEKRGPVEFNHAISYVNKIKNRFASQPDIYKQFLEILQTYQRESKPIQDVYSQVTHLFKTAPDLLDDFKQFLPESAAQAKAAAQARQQAEESVMLSNVRGEPLPYASPVVSRENGMGTPNHGRGLPPVGNFAPTPVTKDNKRKRGERQGTVGSVVDAAPMGGAKAATTGPGGKRIKQTLTAARVTGDHLPASPTLIPSLPSPLPPTSSMAATHEELSFFDRAKKAISNKNTFNEFLKLCNLFSQDLIDRTTLIYRARAFIGNNPDLLKWFVDFVGFDEKDIVVENKARIPGGRVSLSNCRGLGPSYRLLPKRERQKPCSGRDELCYAVLNDEWASHPTWASEDSGFIAHKKNLHEEGLHRIEEERHDYDFNIEACSRTIQLLEPLAQQLRRCSEQEQVAFKLPPGLGGQSETIYKRVIMKLYGRERGQEVIRQLEEHPYQVIPVLLNRLKERLETWKMAQREWEKVWREQTQKMFWRSLDHQYVTARTADKRAFSLKTLQTEVQVKHEEMKLQERVVAGVMHKPQMEFVLEDEDVILDAARLVFTHVEQALNTESPRLIPFFQEFIPLFFNINADWFNSQISIQPANSDGQTSVNDAEDDSPIGADEAASGRGRKANKGNNLLRSALDRGRGSKLGRKDREDSNASASRASTPDVTPNADDDMADAADDVDIKQESIGSRWLDHPASGNMLDGRSIDPNESYARRTFRMWSNTPMYCFVRMFIMLYERLLKLKGSEAECREAVRKGKMTKPGVDLGIVDKVPKDFFEDTSANANYYRQMLAKFDDVLKGDMEFLEVEETLRRFYLQSGYGLYSFEKMVLAISRFANGILSSESKDKSFDIYQLFKRDRVKQATTAQQQTDYRKAVEKMLKEADLYRIDYDVDSRKVKIFYTKKDDPTFDDSLSASDKEHIWRYYIASYTSFAPTEGVEHARLNRPVLLRNLRANGADPFSQSYPPSPAAGASPATAERLARRFNNMRGDQGVELRIAVSTFRPLFVPPSREGWVEVTDERDGGKDGVFEASEASSHREGEIKDNFVNLNVAMKDVSKEEVESANEHVTKIFGDGGVVANGEEMEVD